MPRDLPLVALCAKVKVDIGPVPLTMQTLAVLTIGAAYGSRLGAATMLLYLAEGAAGQHRTRSSGDVVEA